MTGWDLGGDYDQWLTSGYDAYCAEWCGGVDDGAEPDQEEVET